MWVNIRDFGEGDSSAVEESMLWGYKMVERERKV